MVDRFGPLRYKEDIRAVLDKPLVRLLIEIQLQKHVLNNTSRSSGYHFFENAIETGLSEVFLESSKLDRMIRLCNTTGETIEYSPSEYDAYLENLIADMEHDLNRPHNSAITVGNGRSLELQWTVCAPNMGAPEPKKRRVVEPLPLGTSVSGHSSDEVQQAVTPSVTGDVDTSDNW